MPCQRQRRRRADQPATNDQNVCIHAQALAQIRAAPKRT
jgi:hypothetical protein